MSILRNILSTNEHIGDILDIRLKESTTYNTEIAPDATLTNTNSDVEAAIESCKGGWAIDPNLARIISHYIIARGKRNILEFGAGSSSLLIAKLLDHCGGGNLTSVEQDPSWCSEQWSTVDNIDSVDAQMIKCDPSFRIGYMGIYAKYDKIHKVLEKRGEFDMVLIDAPQYYMGREGALTASAPHASNDCIFILDDFNRRGEKMCVYKWIYLYPELHIININKEDKGYAVLRLRNSRQQFDTGLFVAGLLQGARKAIGLHLPAKSTV